mgnify:CR=1 FL=1
MPLHAARSEGELARWRHEDRPKCTKKNDGLGGPGRRGSKDAPYIMLLVSYADFGSRRMSMMPESAI